MTSEGRWGGEPFAPGEVPYPPEHQNHIMMHAPEASPPAQGLLGGLLHWEPTLELGSNFAWSLFFSSAFFGVTLVGTPMAARMDPRASGLFYTLIPAVALVLGGAMGLFRRLSQRKGKVDDNSKEKVVAWYEWPVFLLLVAWLGGGLSGLGPFFMIPILSGIAALLALFLDTFDLAKRGLASPFCTPWLYPSRLAQSLTTGAGLVMPLALTLGMATAEMKLSSRLFAVGLLAHVAVNQVIVSQNSPGGKSLRIGRLCVAYRWVLWLGGLLPMFCLSLYLLKTPMSMPGLALAGPIGALGTWAFIRLALRAAQDVNIEGGEAE